MNNGYIDVSNHPLSLSLNDNHLMILNEFKQLIKTFPPANKPNNFMGAKINQKTSNGKVLYQGNISITLTRAVPESCSIPEKISIWGTTNETKNLTNTEFIKKQKLTPVLESIIRPYEPYIGTVGFNSMQPGAKLSMHYGMVSKYLRFHLGLICDPEAKFYIDNYPPRAWEKGKVWAFDDGEAFHGTIHNGKEERLILFIDVDKTIFNDLKEEIFTSSEKLF